jgi:hypothetical protein
MNARTPAALDKRAIAKAVTQALGVEVRALTSRSWASVTFDGYRCLLETRSALSSDRLDRVLTDRHLIPGYTLADVEIQPGPDRTIRLDLLLAREG